MLTLHIRSDADDDLGLGQREDRHHVVFGRDAKLARFRYGLLASILLRDDQVDPLGSGKGPPVTLHLAQVEFLDLRVARSARIGVIDDPGITGFRTSTHRLVQSKTDRHRDVRDG